MNKKEIKKQYLKKIETINNYNKNYYDKSQPKVDDQLYDNLKNEILVLESKYEFEKLMNENK